MLQIWIYTEGNCSDSLVQCSRKASYILLWRGCFAIAGKGFSVWWDCLFLFEYFLTPENATDLSLVQQKSITMAIRGDSARVILTSESVRSRESRGLSLQGSAFLLPHCFLTVSDFYLRGSSIAGAQATLQATSKAAAVGSVQSTSKKLFLHHQGFLMISLICFNMFQPVLLDVLQSIAIHCSISAQLSTISARTEALEFWEFCPKPGCLTNKAATRSITSLYLIICSMLTSVDFRPRQIPNWQNWGCGPSVETAWARLKQNATLIAWISEHFLASALPCQSNAFKYREAFEKAEIVTCKCWALVRNTILKWNQVRNLCQALARII